MSKENKGNKIYSHHRRHQERFEKKGITEEIRQRDPDERPGGNDNLDLPTGKKVKS